MQPLAGVTVIALEQAVAAPFATRQLADLGARVIKLERPGTGDFARHYDGTVYGLSSYFVWLNRGKESLTLNPKEAAGAQILEALLDRADVFVHNLVPGAVERLGFATERLRTTFPRLIICQISGYGSNGPYRDKKAYDLLIQAEAGLLSITGSEEDPAKAGISVADIAAGMYAYSGILTALLARQQTGAGSTVEVSMLEALGEWMSFPMYYTLGGQPPRRTGARHASIAPYGPYATRDGQVVLIGVQNEREWQRFCLEVIERSDLAGDERFATVAGRVAHRPEIRAAISAVFEQLDQAELLARLEKANIAYGEMRDMHAFWEHPQLRARDRWREVDSPAGELPVLLPPATVEGVELNLGSIPELGADTDTILKELGHSATEIAQLRAGEVI